MEGNIAQFTVGERSVNKRAAVVQNKNTGKCEGCNKVKEESLIVSKKDFVLLIAGSQLSKSQNDGGNSKISLEAP